LFILRRHTLRFEPLATLAQVMAEVSGVGVVCGCGKSWMRQVVSSRGRGGGGEEGEEEEEEEEEEEGGRMESLVGACGVVGGGGGGKQKSRFEFGFVSV
jgi:hypothetical protein